ncbi:FtsX-like permease family protein [Planomicrobium okeanokoites]|uniref:FtsX-like permease family protein n=1 Tax=Planomicrobium okeanokoites TaxID=244 RepID=A0ABV7KT47_PLAOK|nr:FtsX-like permease family protein [Planomicrobium okeanokoites]TAA70216.1 FtsX-like permease family protein [Planomicrobium okeanokoites]
MLKFIWNSWWRNKERFILLLVGVLILSTGLSYLVGITQANNGTVVDELQKRWKSSYHIVVRPEGSRSVTEELNLLEPNYLSGLEGGISLEQYEQIKAMADVEIAAPIAMIGSNTNYVELEDPNITEPGIYRMKMVEETNTGAGIQTEETSTYVTAGGWMPSGTTAIDYGISPGIPILSYGTSIMIAGIDPEAEAAMAGLDEAIIVSDSSRYFNESDVSAPTGEVLGDTPEYKVPALISNQDFVDAKLTYSFEKLDIAFDADQQAIAEDILSKGGEEYLDEFEGTPVKEFTYQTTDVHEKLTQKILNPYSEAIRAVPDQAWIAAKPSIVKYTPVTSPFPERWPYTYEVEPFELPEDSPWATKHMYRQVNPYSYDSSKWPKLRLDFVGVFDPQKLQISKDPLTELPMETYFPAKAQWVMDSDNNPINPPAEMKPTNDDYGFLTKPPLVLTTLEAAAQILGDTPISAIRVNVKGVEMMDEESEALLQEVAAEIEQQTGLITDITLGSSPQLALTHLPGLDGEEALGWVQQPWIKIGSSISIFKEAKIGMSGVIASVILVAIVYVFASSIIMLFARKKEFAVLLALGWRHSQLSKLLFLEATILGILVALISWFILGAFFVSGSVDTSAFRVFLIGVSGLAIYWLGSLIPIALIRRIKPFESMRSGEVSHRAKRIVRSESVIGMSFNNLFSQWQRSVLSVFAIAVPTSLFIFFLFVTFRLQGVLYATWLGEFVALEVGTMHYVAMGVALLIAILTTTEIMWQNVSERQAQIAVLKATGWQNNSVRFLVLWEGVLTGLLAGIIGMAISLVIIYSMYGQLPTEELGFLSLTMLIPVITGVLGALLPAEKAARILPYQAINGTLQNSKKVEKQFKWALGAAGATLVAGIFSLFLFTLPEINNEPSGNVSETATTGTEGELLADAPEKDEPEESDVVEEVAETATGEIAKLQEIAYRSYTLGDGTDDTAEFRLGDLVETPAGVQVSDEKNRLISFPVTLDRSSETEGGSTTYKPHGFKMMDDKGTEYPVVNMEVTEGGDKWRHKYKFLIPNKMTAILTYELPKDLDRAVFVASGEFYPSPVVVEIPLGETDSASGISPGASAAYNIDLALDEQDVFQISAEIDVTNESQDSWTDIGFYFIPNALTDANKPDFMEDGAETAISSITADGEEIPFELVDNRLMLKLDAELKPDEKKTVKIDYTLKLPENGNRLSQVDDNFYLAQWYPMLGHYSDGWNIEDYDSKGESYHTSYGSYEIDYQLPAEYLVASSAVDGEVLPTASGTLAGDNIKDFYLALMDPDDWHTAASSVNNTALRVYIPSAGLDFTADMMAVTEDAFAFFEERIADHPAEELDVIANDGGMEYPNIIEVNSNPDDFEHTLIHEIAHQWFYYLVANDPYTDSWLDEGITEWVAAMYMVEEGYPDPFKFAERMAQTSPTAHLINLPLSEFERGDYYSTIYGKTPLLLQEYFEANGGSDAAFDFLSAYVEQFRFDYVNTEKFAEFFVEQHGEDSREFLNSWLDLEKE